jgi:hypothetical protein
MASSANIGRVLWPKKAKTHEINKMATKSGLELSCMTVLLAPLTTPKGIICARSFNLIQIKNPVAKSQTL